MIPEFMSEIFLILELRIEESHEFDDGEGVSLSSLPVFNGQHVIDHFLHVPAVFPHFQMVAGGIVLHKLSWVELRSYVNSRKSASAYKPGCFSVVLGHRHAYRHLYQVFELRL